MPLKTLRGRLNRILTLMLVLVFLAQWVVLNVAIRRVSEEQMLMHLEHDSGAMMAALDFSGATPVLDVHGLEPVYSELNSGHYYVVRIDGKEAFASASLGAVELDTSSDEPTRAHDYRTPGPANQPLIVVAHTELLKGHQVRMFVAEDLSRTNRAIWQLSLTSVLVFAPLLAGALLLQGLGVRRALQPLVAVGDRLREVGAGKQAQIDGDVPLEIKPLVDELNRLLTLLQRRLEQSRTALGNLAHTLKTPLAVLFRSAEDPQMAPELALMVRSQADAIRERLERELRRARLAGTSGSGAGAYFNPAVELPVLLRVLKRVYSDKTIDFQLAVPDALLPFDREDMLELVGNLADNACKWAAARAAITIAGAEDGPKNALRLTVTDDGPGCPVQDVQEILKRGVRLDEAVSGHGLGLTITQDIVDSYGGHLDIDRDPQLGGLRVTIALPPPASA